MLLTPSMIGALLAGICLWLMFWAALHKIEEIPTSETSYPPISAWIGFNNVQV